MQADRQSSLHPVFNDGRVWLVSAMIVSLIISAVYYITHPYPAYGAGLFLAMADQIQATGYHFPTTIPHYTLGGVPFAYPPLQFFVVAVLLDLGADPLLLTRVLPGSIIVLYLIPFYALSKEILDSVQVAGLATVILAATPDVLSWHLSAGGIVRAPAYLLLLTGLYSGVRLFKTGQRQWLASSVVLFGLMVLSHPTYTSFFATSYLLLYVAYDRSLWGLVRGASVAAGGFILAAPWWTHVLNNYGMATVTGAAATHEGLINELPLIISRLSGPFHGGNAILVWNFLIFAGIAVSLWRREGVLPAWFALAVLVMNEPRFPLVPGVMLAAVALHSLLTHRLGDGTDADWQKWRSVARWGIRGSVVVVVGFMIFVGGVYASGSLVGGGPSMVSFIDDDDMTTMDWVQNETPPDAKFVVLGDAGEWFPYFTDRTMLVGRWGVEWTTPAEYRAQLTKYWELSTCNTEQCLTETLHRHNVNPEYVYVPTEQYAALGIVQHQPPSMRQSLVDSEKYQLEHESEGAAVFRVVGEQDITRKNSSHSQSTSSRRTTTAITNENVDDGVAFDQFDQRPSTKHSTGPL